MNLADIRKKAKKDKAGARGEVAVAPASIEESLSPNGGMAATAEMLPEEQAPEIPVTALPQMPEAAAKTEQSNIFDPLDVLLIGRKNAVLLEDQVLSVSALEEASATMMKEFLCFKVANETYAVSILEIKEIIKPRTVTEVPRVPDFVSGVLSLRGIIIPVFQMRHRLGLPRVGASGKERIIVVKQGEGFCGLLVDEVIQVVKISAEGIEPPPTVLDGIDRDFVSGIGRHEGQMLILLNLGKILDVSLC